MDHICCRHCGREYVLGLICPDTPDHGGECGPCADCCVLRAKITKLERDQNMIYAIINSAPAKAIRDYIGTEIADEIIKAERDRIDYLQTHVAELEAVVSRIRTWAHEHGAALCPPGADTYGEGKREAKREVASILSAALRGGG